jgi:hypothetical protein
LIHKLPGCLVNDMSMRYSFGFLFFALITDDNVNLNL